MWRPQGKHVGPIRAGDFEGEGNGARVSSDGQHDHSSRRRSNGPEVEPGDRQRLGAGTKANKCQRATDVATASSSRPNAGSHHHVEG
jgi:hypothetical protein